MALSASRGDGEPRVCEVAATAAKSGRIMIQDRIAFAATPVLAPEQRPHVFEGAIALVGTA